MPVAAEPRNAILEGWDAGEGGWKEGMDGNLLKVGALLGLSVIDKDLTAPPGSPVDGDMYIPASPATGDWATHENKIAIWRDDVNAWELYDVTATRSRLLCYVEDENRLVVWNGSNWLQGVTFS